MLRVIDSLQLTAQYSVATPVNWQHGDACMVVPTLSDEQATQKASCPWPPTCAWQLGCCSKQSVTVGCACLCMATPTQGCRSRVLHTRSADSRLLQEL